MVPEILLKAAMLGVTAMGPNTEAPPSIECPKSGIVFRCPGSGLEYTEGPNGTLAKVTTADGQPFLPTRSQGHEGPDIYRNNRFANFPVTTEVKTLSVTERPMNRRGHLGAVTQGFTPQG